MILTANKWPWVEMPEQRFQAVASMEVTANPAAKPDQIIKANQRFI